MALGRLKWTPYTFWTCSPQEFYYACKGYFDERKEDEAVAWKMAYSFRGGPVSEFEKSWPFPMGSGKRKNLVLDDDMREQIMKAHNIQLKNKDAK